MTIWLLLALHLLAMALWVGGMGFALLALRPSLGLLEPPQRLAFHAAVLKRFFLIVWHAMPIMLLTGWAMVFVKFGGFAFLPVNINIMQLIGLAMAAVFLVVFFGPWKAVRADLAAGQPAAAAAGFTRIRQLVALNFVLGLLTVVIATWNG
jgi:uncharacterized membrane protein